MIIRWPFLLLLLSLLSCAPPSPRTGAVPAPSPSLSPVPTPAAGMAGIDTQGAGTALLPAPAPSPAAGMAGIDTQGAGTAPLPAPAPRTGAVPAPSPSPAPAPSLAPAPVPALRQYGYPIGLAGQPLGLGFFVRHGYASENTWYNPNYWHTGEDWYAITGDSAGALVYAIAAGEVVYVGANYPGRVVIVRHPGDLYSMYGHLDPMVIVAEGASVERGSQLGTVLRRADAVPNHLHFEVRTFVTTPAVNGAQPRYAFRCGPRCPPGPGYWPIAAPDHPSDQGWRNPTHVINGRSFAVGASAPLGAVVATGWRDATVTLRQAPDDRAPVVTTIAAPAGTPFELLAISAGPEDSREPSALGYHVWYQVAHEAGQVGWARAAVADPFETGADGRPSSMYLTLVPT